LENALLLPQQPHGRERVEQHLGGASIGSDLSRDGDRCSAVSHRGEQVQFQCRQNRPALLKGPNAFVQIVGEHAGGLSGTARLEHSLAVCQEFRANIGRIGPDEALDGCLPLKVRLNDFRHVIRDHA
jgi:hypothetical protein